MTDLIDAMPDGGEAFPATTGTFTPQQRAMADSIEAEMRLHFRADPVRLRCAALHCVLRIERDAIVIEGGRVPYEVYVGHRPDGTSNVEVCRHGLTFHRQRVASFGDCITLGNTLTSIKVDAATVDRAALIASVAAGGGVGQTT